jgi:hypothetical protein
MVKFVEMDARITLFEQMQDRAGPVVLINKFNVRPDEVDQLLAAWTADAALMRRPAIATMDYTRAYCARRSWHTIKEQGCTSY